jgi:hypothetical protein
MMCILSQEFSLNVAERIQPLSQCLWNFSSDEQAAAIKFCLQQGTGLFFIVERPGCNAANLQISADCQSAGLLIRLAGEA